MTLTTAINTLPTLVGVDVGGTFTDFVVFHQGDLRVHKVPTTPDDQSRAILAGLHALDLTLSAPHHNGIEIIHGMTVATNALLERRGAATALLTTAGFADVLVIGRQNRPHVYRLSQTRPEPLVADEWRLAVNERLDSGGNVVEPLDEEEVLQLARRLAASGIESLAIVFLFSFRNPLHEQAAAACIRQALPDLPLSLSSDILPEYREYERTATTVINAYVQPLVATYMSRLATALDGFPVRIMQSNGGAIGLQQAARQAARLVLSGPAGGVVGAFTLAQQAMLIPEDSNQQGTAPLQNPKSKNLKSRNANPNLITFDMGGTSTDVALCPGAIPTTPESIITDLPLRLPVIDIHTVGAGGGSIASVDAGGSLRVGPRSAGADPGPVCYGRGGTEPTVTDANLVLGRLDPGGFLGGTGTVALDEEGAQRALSALGAKLGFSAAEAALGIVRVANATMERALRRVSVERGHDPRAFVLLPFGGAGPLHACDLADALDVQRILIPPMPGVLSAYGMLVADIVSDTSHAVLLPADRVIDEPAALAAHFDNLADRVRATLQREGVTAPHLDASLDLRYQGQSYELTVPLDLPISEGTVVAAVNTFHASHEQRYGYAMCDEQVDIITLRVRGTGPGAQPELPTEPRAHPDASAAILRSKPVWFTSDTPTTTACYDRNKLRAGHGFDGPAIVFQFDTTTVITPGWRTEVDTLRNLWLTRNA